MFGGWVSRVFGGCLVGEVSRVGCMGLLGAGLVHGAVGGWLGLFGRCVWEVRIRGRLWTCSSGDFGRMSEVVEGMA